MKQKYYHFQLAKPAMVDDVFRLIVSRIEWMEQQHIQQWNTTHYTEVFPKEYYLEMIKQHHLYVLKDDEKIIGAAIILEKDTRWNDDTPSYYIHNFVSDVHYQGAGGLILQRVEDMARQDNKDYVRLDCMSSNEALNHYYEKKGYQMVGYCQEGEYHGHCRQKKIDKNQ